MKVSDILRVKGGTLFTVSPDEPLARAIDIMAEKDIGSLVVMDHGDLVGMLTYREVIQCIVANKHVPGNVGVRTAMGGRQARRLCPEAVVVPPRLSTPPKMHRAFEIVRMPSRTRMLTPPNKQKTVM